MLSAPISIPDHREHCFQVSTDKEARSTDGEMRYREFCTQKALTLENSLACQEADQIEMVIGHVDQDRMLQLKQRMIRFQDVGNILAKEDTDRLKLADFPRSEALGEEL